MPNYTQSGSLNDKSYNLTNVMQPIGPSMIIKKLRENTPLELEMAGTASAIQLVGANGVRFELRIVDQTPNYKIQGSLKAAEIVDTVVIKSVYENLKPGSYKAQIYASAAPTGSATGVVLDPGGWGAVILATEF